MAAYNKFTSFATELGKATHNLSTHALKVVLSNTAPVATNTVLADIVQIAETGGYVAGGYALDSVTWAAGKLTIADEVITAAGGVVGPFRFLVVYNSTPVGGPLISWFDYGAALTLNDTETLTLDFDGTNGVFTLG